MESSDLNRPLYLKALKFMLIFFMGLVSTALSWLSVACFIGSFVHERMKDSGAPSLVREYRWKLRNVDMTFDQIISEMVKVNGDNADGFDSLKRDITRGMEERGLMV